MVVLAACSSSAQSPRPPSPNDVVASVGSTQITLTEVDEKALNQPVSNFGSERLSQALYEARLAAIDDIVASKLLDQEAKTQHIERAALVEREITSKIPTVTDAQIAEWYQANQNRVQGASLDQARQAIRNYLTQDRMQRVRDAYLGSLRAKTNVRVMLDPPRQQISTANSPSRGPSSAPIELVEFSDFQCPFCLRADPTVRQVLATYGDRIKLVYRHFPLPNHPNARPAAEAAACAEEQGKFWQYHDKLFADPGHLEIADLKQRASELGLDKGKFDACVDSHASRARVDADVRDGQEAGVNGTPAFFINGRMLSGAQPFEQFKRLIDEELQLKNTK
jgi:protein-disulfide isomerase